MNPDKEEGRPSDKAATPETHEQGQDNRPDAEQVNISHPTQPPLPGLENVGGRDVNDLQWMTDAEAALAELSATGRHFTADDLRKRVGVPEQRNRIGTAFMIAAVRGDIVLEGFAHSATRSRHRGVQRIWRGAA